MKASSTRQRSDTFGNQIKPGGKKHKIGFRPNLVDVFEVESYKQYNVDDGIQDTKTCCNIM